MRWMAAAWLLMSGACTPSRQKVVFLGGGVACCSLETGEPDILTCGEGIKIRNPANYVLTGDPCDTLISKERDTQ